jgi:hypothetical protein
MKITEKLNKIFIKKRFSLIAHTEIGREQQVDK